MKRTSLFSYYSSHNSSLLEQEQHLECKRKCENYCIMGSMYCVFFVVLLIIGISGGGIYVGTHNDNATCYDAKALVSLSGFLIFTNTTNLFVWSIMVILAIIASSYDDAIKSYNAVYIFFVGIAIGSVLYSLTMIVVGIMELIYQYIPCITEVKSVCIMTVFTIIINSFYIFGLAIKWKFTGKDGYNQL